MKYLIIGILKSNFLKYLLLPFFLYLSVSSVMAQTIVFKNIRVFDGENLLKNRIVIVKDGFITFVGKEKIIPYNAEIIDGTGKTLLPGLIDSHVHVISKEALRQSLNFGITTVIDMFMSVDLMQEIKKIHRENPQNTMAYLISAGMLATAPDGHGTQYGIPIQTLSSPEQAYSFVTERIKEGSDFIKIIYDNGSWMGKEIPTLDYKTLEAVINAAHAKNQMAVAHALTLKEAKEAISAGIDGLAHIYCDDAYDENFAQLAVENDIFVIPTLSVIKSLCGFSTATEVLNDSLLAPFLSPGGEMLLNNKTLFDSSETRYYSSIQAGKQLNEANVPILAGTDVPNPGTTYGASLHKELELLTEAGLTPIQALRAATSFPAKCFGLSQRGFIKKGMIADLLLVRGNPINDIQKTRDIVAIWKRGNQIKRVRYKEKY